jgi:hypothetical protein
MERCIKHGSCDGSGSLRCNENCENWHGQLHLKDVRQGCFITLGVLALVVITTLLLLIF